MTTSSTEARGTLPYRSGQVQYNRSFIVLQVLQRVSDRHGLATAKRTTHICPNVREMLFDLAGVQRLIDCLRRHLTPTGLTRTDAGR